MVTEGFVLAIESINLWTEKGKKKNNTERMI
jgi:hypothetical protein